MDLYASSKQLIMDYSTRSQNHHVLLAALKEVTTKNQKYLPLVIANSAELT
jgi:hypothetical protein